MSRVMVSRIRGSMIRTAVGAVLVGIAWTATTVPADATPTARQVTPSGPYDPRCILAQGNPICANGPWVAVPNAPQNPLPSGPADDLSNPANPLSPENPSNPQNPLNPANPLSPLNPTSPTNPMNTA